MRNLTLFSLLNLALKYLWVLFISAAVFASGAFAYCEFLATPQYSATGSVLVTNGAILSTDYIEEEYTNDSTINNTDIVASINFADTVTDILNTNGIFKKLANQLDNKYSYTNLISRAAIRRKSENTLFINVTFRATSQAEAVLLVNEFLKLVPGYINEFVPSTSAISTSTADTAAKIFPQTFFLSLASGTLGAVLAYGIIVVVYSLNTTITNEEDIKERFGVDVLAAIPDFSAAKSDKYYKKHPYYAYYTRGGTTNAKNSRYS